MKTRLHAATALGLLLGATPLAHWMLSIFKYMVPGSEQPVRAAKVAELLSVALRIAPAGVAGQQPIAGELCRRGGGVAPVFEEHHGVGAPHGNLAELPRLRLRSVLADDPDRMARHRLSDRARPRPRHRQLCARGFGGRQPHADPLLRAPRRRAPGATRYDSTSPPPARRLRPWFARRGRERPPARR